MARTWASIVAVVSATVLFGWSAGVAARAELTDEIPVAELERAFWRCDYEATQRALDVGTAAQCGEIAEAFKARRFGGDFGALLAWWRHHKDAEHLALADADRAHARVGAPAGR